MIAGLLLGCLQALAAPGVELVLVLDNRAGRAPDVQEQAAAALFERLDGGESRLTVIGLGEDAESPPQILTERGQLDGLLPVASGSLLPALNAARAVLDTSPRDAGLLVVVADGELTEDARAVRAALPPPTRGSVSWVSWGEPGPIADLAGSSWDLQRVEPGVGVEALSRALLSASRLALAPPGLSLELILPPELEAGVSTTPRARLLRDGQPVADPSALLGADYEALIELGGAAVPLELQPDGSWAGRWTPPGPEGPVHGSLRLRSAEFELRADAESWIEGALTPVLLANPTTLDLGTWESASDITSRCAVVDLSGSLRAAQLNVRCLPAAPEGGVFLTCSPEPDQAPGGPALRWRVCGHAPPCCRDAPEAEDPPLTVRFVQQDELVGELLATVPVSYRVVGQDLLRCRGPGVIATVFMAGIVLALLGLGRPPGFSDEIGVALASSEPGLRRATVLGLRRLARARRALWARRVFFDERGAPLLDEAGAALVLEPLAGGAVRVARGESLERRLAQSAGWAPVDESERISGLQVGTVYRVGARLYFTLV